MPLTLSPYVAAIDVEPGWKGLYVPFEHGVCFISSSLWSTITDGNLRAAPPHVLALLATKHVLVEPGFEDRYFESLRLAACAPLNAMFLVVTRHCNLACRYCVVECNVAQSHRDLHHMTVATGLAAITFFERVLSLSQPRQTRVTYYGGEPTLNKPVLLATLPRIASMSYPGQVAQVGAALITNGYTFDADICRMLRETRTAVCVSLDGESQHHDLARLTAHGRTTHSKVVENIRRYQDAGLDVDLSCTIGRHNIQHLPEIARYFVREIGIKDIEIQIPYLVATGNPDYIPADEVAKQLLAAYDVLLGEGTQEYTCYRRVQDFLASRWRIRDCGAAGGQITVDPDGQLGPCHSMVGNKEFFTGSVHDSSCDVCQSPLFQEWSTRIPINMDQCRHCPYIALCGGGCMFNAWVATKDIWQKDPQVCPYMQALVAWLVRHLWMHVRGTRATAGNVMDSTSVTAAVG